MSCIHMAIGLALVVYMLQTITLRVALPIFMRTLRV